MKKDTSLITAFSYDHKQENIDTLKNGNTIFCNIVSILKNTVSIFNCLHAKIRGSGSFCVFCFV